MTDEVDDVIERVVAETRAFREARPSPDLVGRVMREVAQIGVPPAREDPGGVARVLRALWTPRLVSIRVRPAHGLMAAASIALVLYLPIGPRPTPTDQAGATDQAGGVPAAAGNGAQAGTERTLFVQFHFQASEVSRVQLAGSFTNWEPRYELLQTTPGHWTVTLPLVPGVHDYAFVIDGQQWVADPFAPSVHDGFGGVNSRLAILPPEDARL